MLLSGKGFFKRVHCGFFAVWKDLKGEPILFTATFASLHPLHQIGAICLGLQAKLLCNPAHN
jgi:hypothetical protein